MQHLPVSIVHHDVISDIGVHRCRERLRRRVHKDAAGVIDHIIICDGHQARVLDHHGHHMWGGEVVDPDSAILDPAAFYDNGGIEFASVLEVEGSSLVPSDRCVMDMLTESWA